MNVLDFGNFGVYYATVLACLGGEVRHVMEVPADSAVATMDVDNALSLVHLPASGKCQLETVKKSFLDMVSGPFEYRFTQPWSADEVAYTMTRGVVIANLKTKKVETYTVDPGLRGQIDRFAVLNPEDRTFVFQDVWPSLRGLVPRALKVMRFQDGHATAVGELPANESHGRSWFVFERHLFAFDPASNRLMVWDSSLRPATHPLADVLNEEFDAGTGVWEVLVHPSLPLAFVVAELPPAYKKLSPDPNAYGIFILRWTAEQKAARLTPWFGDKFSPWGTYQPVLGGFPALALSPDGQWLLMQTSADTLTNEAATARDAPVAETYWLALPVTPTMPDKGTKPVKLAIPEGIEGATVTGALTREPVSLVAARTEQLLQWNLDQLKDAKWIRPKRSDAKADEPAP